MNGTSGIPIKLLDVRSLDFMKKNLEESCMRTIKNGGWILVSPNGEMYQGDIQKITSVIMINHPLLKPQPPEVKQ